MEFGRGRRGRWVSTGTASGLLWVSFFFCLSLLALLADAGRTDAHSSAAGASCGRAKDFPSPIQVPAATAALEDEAAWRRSTMTTTTPRYLVGLGSYPPRCTSKCGECTPCKPVHVPVPPGTAVITEYYPEAWRCKCGGKLYMP